ncbi:MAG: ATP-binding protein [Woronichinia naegeliana WA131]|jgi:AAA15 family ATPase/GTPase|uniref:ATP-binding protein n=1 Tax=Woronichinia naegeliana WA131 TaxID=2824559 RepID=A0A977KV72_9CYAN|nr:MAG: ATP-binding protein [Woronichinia naegeliana WA131]
MELVIKNLGPIKGNQQSIDLSKKFFIFLGYNNSGKTYVSQLLWTIFNQDKHIKFIKSTFADGVLEEVCDENHSDDWQIELTQSLLDSILEKFGLFLQKEIFTVYNQDQPDSERDKSSIFFKATVNDFIETQVTTVVTIDFPGKLELGYSLETRRLQITKSINSLVLNVKWLEPFDEVPQDCIRLHYNKISSEATSRKLSCLILAILQIILNMSVGFKHGKLSSTVQFFLPASRAFFSMFYTYIYEIERNKGEEDRRLISELTSIEEIRKKIFRRSYTQPVSQAIEALYELNHNPLSLGIYNARLIELAEIMGGDIILDRVENIGPVQFSFRFKENKQEIDLPMYLASSSANQLTLLYLYFKYWAREKGNFLIIDEPEVNLHPENQIKLLDLLINFVSQSDNKVLIATHSPLLADAVNNYLYIDNLRQYYDNEQIKEIIADNELQYLYPDTKLSREDLGVYFFTGDEIISYDRGHYGIYFRNFKDTTISLKKSSETLTDYIYDKENE